jgi:phage gpG-like protein
MRGSQDHQGRMSDVDVERFVDLMQATISQLEAFDFAPVFTSMLETLHQGFESNFDQTRAPYGQWPPHSPMTIAIHGPHPLLILTGVMKRSVTQSGVEGRIEDIMKNEAIIGTSLFYAPYQQFGTSGPHPIPARPFLWLEGSYVDRLHERFVDEVESRLFGTGSV